MCSWNGICANKMSNVTCNIRKSSATDYEPVNYMSTKIMIYGSIYKIMWIGKGLTPYRVKIKVNVSGNRENFEVLLPKCYVGKLNGHFIYRINHDGKYMNLSLMRKQRTKCNEYHFVYSELTMEVCGYVKKCVRMLLC